MEPQTVWNKVLEFTKSAEKKGMEPVEWAIEVSSTLDSSGVCMPSVELAHLLVSHICWQHNLPITWKYLDKALARMLLPPMLLLALLSTRVIASRRSQPGAYRLYMELLKRYGFSFKSQVNTPNYQKIMKSINEVLGLSEIFDLQVNKPGVLLVEYVFSIMWQLLDATLDDEGFLEVTQKKSKWATRLQDMEIDGDDNAIEKLTEHHERLLKSNSVMAVEQIGHFLQNKLTSRLLYLVQKNMPIHWSAFMQNIQLLGDNSSAIRSSKLISPESLLRHLSDIPKVSSQQSRTSQQKDFHAVLASGSLTYSARRYHCDPSSAIWLPLDMFLEDASNGSLVAPSSAIENLCGYIKCLQAVNGSTWHNTFLGLWFAAIRHVQRERDPIEGPVPRLDTRLCMLLSITTLAIADIVEEEEVALLEETEHSTNQWNHKHDVTNRRNELVSSLQMLGDYEGLLTAPPSIISAANQAATKAMMLVSGLTVGSGYLDCISSNDLPVNCSGNLWHLIVEACIARNLLDTSAYFWPGYVKGHISQITQSMPEQVCGWSSLMKGAPLTPSIVNTLVSSPASSLAELEKIYDIAVSGSDDEKTSAATIFCGASFIRGWNIQEYTVRFITKLLSPPIPSDRPVSDSHLIGLAPSLNTLIVGISSVDAVQILSLHGLVPQLAGALMEICEVFGSCIPNLSWTLPTGEDINAYVVFSNAFTLLLRLWRFNHPPLEHVLGDVPPVWSQLTPEYLLLVRNSQVVHSSKDRNRSGKLSTDSVPSSTQPIFVDSFPRLKRWYRQHQACIASPLSGLVHGSPVHQIVDGLLEMLFRKMNKTGGQTVASGSNSSLDPGSEDISLKQNLTAWEILEAVPFVVDAALTACSHGRLSPRELATGLRDLQDYLPASLATIVSYFSAEVTRGVWKPAFMNGTDWPSPAGYLATAEEQIKRILATTGVDVPSLAQGGTAPATLPLPLAAFVSHTITYKLDKASERFLNLAGPALENLAAGCPWPCMPIVASLWAQKAKRWSDFLIFSASRTVFHHNSDAVVQLIKSCFTATLGLGDSHITSGGGIGALLGHGIGSHFYGGFSAVAPGILYLQVYHCIRDIMFMTEEILSLLMWSVREIITNGQHKDIVDKLRKTKNGMRYRQVSLAEAMRKVKVAASLGASLVWLSGGSGLVLSLIQETLPSWFLSVQGPEQQGCGGMGAMLGGYALAYFAVMCGTFAWGVDSVSPGSKRRPKVLGAHFEFMASALDGKISLGCDWATWRAYVSGFISMVVRCTPLWLSEVDVDVLKSLSKGLRQWNDEELALALLASSGIGAMGAAAELVIGSE